MKHTIHVKAKRRRPQQFIRLNKVDTLLLSVVASVRDCLRRRLIISEVINSSPDDNVQWQSWEVKAWREKDQPRSSSHVLTLCLSPSGSLPL